MKIRPVGAKLFHVNARTDRQTDMTKPMVAFRNFAETPIKALRVSHRTQLPPLQKPTAQNCIWTQFTFNARLILNTQTRDDKTQCLNTAAGSTYKISHQRASKG